MTVFFLLFELFLQSIINHEMIFVYTQAKLSNLGIRARTLVSTQNNGDSTFKN